MAGSYCQNDITLSVHKIFVSGFCKLQTFPLLYKRTVLDKHMIINRSKNGGIKNIKYNFMKMNKYSLFSIFFVWKIDLTDFLGKEYLKTKMHKH